MKKIIYLLIGLSLFANMPIMALAVDEEIEEEIEQNEEEEVELDLTVSENVVDKDTFLEAVMVKKEELERLRTQINETRDSNNQLMQKLRSNIRNQSREEIKAKLAEIKNLRKKIKDEVSKAKELIQEKNRLEDDVTEDLDGVVSTNSRKEDLNDKLNSKKDVVGNYRFELENLKQEIKEFREEKQLEYQQMKQIHAKVKTSEKNLGEQQALQNQIWTEFKDSIEDEDYKEAIDAFDNVIEVKTNMLNELETREELLNELNDLY